MAGKPVSRIHPATHTPPRIYCNSGLFPSIESVTNVTGVASHCTLFVQSVDSSVFLRKQSHQETPGRTKSLGLGLKYEPFSRQDFFTSLPGVTEPVPNPHD